MSDEHAPTHPDIADAGGYALRVEALEALLAEKGTLTTDEIRETIEATDARSPVDGARVVARAWVDPEFKARLLSDPKGTLAGLGFATLPEDPRIAVLENTDEAHHIVVCTLCSCYPRALLGRPPDWYKSFAYRSRAVTDPRGIMREFGLELSDDVEVRVGDSTSEMRYMVLPQRPRGTEGMSEDELAQLITRDSLIGVTNPRTPEAAASSA